MFCAFSRLFIVYAHEYFPHTDVTVFLGTPEGSPRVPVGRYFWNPELGHHEKRQMKDFAKEGLSEGQIEERYSQTLKIEISQTGYGFTHKYLGKHHGTTAAILSLL